MGWDGWVCACLVKGGLWQNVPVDLVVFEEGEGAVAVVGLECAGGPVGGVDALEVAWYGCRCGCVYGCDWGEA